MKTATRIRSAITGRYLKAADANPDTSVAEAIPQERPPITTVHEMRAQRKAVQREPNLALLLLDASGKLHEHGEDILARRLYAEAMRRS